MLIDATEQPVPQPVDKHRRKRAYRGKQHDHTIKTQILASKRLILASKTLILHVFGGLPGCLHDQMLLGASGVLGQVPTAMRIRIDKGYHGTATRYPHLSVQQPIKKRCGHRLTGLERTVNHFLSVQRMPVEHHVARLQTYRILADVFRGRAGARRPTSTSSVLWPVCSTFGRRAASAWGRQTGQERSAPTLSGSYQLLRIES